ncbi:MAG TPA: hypothetical protein VGZ00_13435 [Candidatus Baltobacteraceae bacterium]|jgi:hypothetical protein|nr:hypothetical protein [Candidatus Baltobacteraceae bacterium]
MCAGVGDLTADTHPDRAWYASGEETGRDGATFRWTKARMRIGNARKLDVSLKYLGLIFEIVRQRSLRWCVSANERDAVTLTSEDWLADVIEGIVG